MASVWIVSVVVDWDGFDVIGAFSSEELAMAAVKDWAEDTAGGIKRAKNDGIETLVSCVDSGCEAYIRRFLVDGNKGGVDG